MAGRLRRRISTGVVGMALAGAAAAAPLAGQATDAGLQRLEAEIAELAKISGGTVGVAGIHLETGREVYLNADDRFPMASTYKVPIAVQLLSRVDRGEIRLDSLVEVLPHDLHPGSGTLSELFDDPGVLLSTRNLLELMLLISDNSATDMSLELAGGPDRVNARLAELGVRGVRVDRPTSRLIGDWIGVRGIPESGDITQAEFRRLAQAVDSAQRAAAGAAFRTDPRDTSTPRGMADLLRKVWDGEALTPERTELFWDVMRRVSTGQGRIKGMLPPWVEVAHKTGTIGATTNDVGLIYLPRGAGHVVTVVFVKDSGESVETRERAIAQISRALYDYFLFDPR